MTCARNGLIREAHCAAPRPRGGDSLASGGLGRRGHFAGAQGSPTRDPLESGAHARTPITTPRAIRYAQQDRLLYPGAADSNPLGFTALRIPSGDSTGTPSESALIADAQATYDVVGKTHAKVIVMGRSLGTGVAAALATTHDIEKVVLLVRDFPAEGRSGPG